MWELSTSSFIFTVRHAFGYNAHHLTSTEIMTGGG